MDTSQRWNWLEAELDLLQGQGLRRRRRVVTPLPGGECLVEGRPLWNFAGNDYLDLAHDPRVLHAAKQALEAGDVGAGATASALVAGRSHWHELLEQRLARFEQQPAALLFPTGFAANVGTVSSLAGREDVVFCDRLNHASLVDGCRASGARLRVYRHDDLPHLEAELAKAAAVRRRWIITDSVFSMDGDVAPLKELCDLAERYQAQLILDEAHATGVLGEQGRGLAEALGVEQRVAVRVGTLSKALGTLGGFVAGPQTLIDWLWNKARPQMFSTALPPGICAAAVTALDIVTEEPWRRERVHALARQLSDHVATRLPTRPTLCKGWASALVTPIVPVLLDTPERATAVAAELERRGFFVAAIRPPTVPRGTSRLRISLSAAHDDATITALADALVEVLA